MNFKEWLLITEIAEPVRPLGKVALRNIIKDGGTWRGRSVKEYRFKTTKGNEIKLHFDKLNHENGYDVMFYVNDTQYDSASGGDSEILGNILWLMRKKADQLKANVLTFTAQKGDGDTRVIRNMDTNRFKSVALQELAKMRSIITSYQIKMVKPKAEVFIRLGRPVPPDYPDLDKEKYLKILSAYELQIDSIGELVTNTTHLFQDLSRLNIDASGFIDAMKRLWDTQESNTERGFHSHRNRREFVWEKLMNRHFSGDWLMEKSGVKFRLSRKKSLSERTLTESVDKRLILMRGISGSGKSTKAKQLGIGGAVYSTDDFFYSGGKYNFDSLKLGEYHKKNIVQVEAAMIRGITPIVVDNTNTTAPEMKPYVLLADKHGYSVTFEKPDTSWAWDAEELARRNSHGVPLDRIQAMLGNFDHSVDLEKVRSSEDYR